MRVIFYSCKDAHNVLNKNVGAAIVDTPDARPYDGCTVQNPVIVMQYNPTLVGCNYAYIPEFNRYYYIGNIELQTGQRCIIPMNVDVLMSFRDEIKNVPMTAERSSNIPNSYLHDNEMELLAYPQNEYHSLGYFYGTRVYLMGVM